MTTTHAIEVRGLRRAFGDHLVLDDIDLDVRAGTVFALLGPNGAGKTTMVKILSTLIHADGGELRVGGHDVVRDPAAVRSVIGVTGQFSAVDGLLTGEQNLRLMADLNHLGRRAGRRRASELLELFGLTEQARMAAATYSGGMRRKLDLAMTLLGNPQVIFLDEPTSGLDPSSRRDVWRLIGELVADGVTVFLTTQHLEEADQLAQDIAVLHHGTLVAQGTPQELKRLIPGSRVHFQFADGVQRDAAVQALAGLDLSIEPLAVEVPGDGLPALRSLLDRLDHAGVQVADLSLRTPTLDDVFLALVAAPAPPPALSSPAPAPPPGSEPSMEVTR